MRLRGVSVATQIFEDETRVLYKNNCVPLENNFADAICHHPGAQAEIGLSSAQRRVGTEVDLGHCRIKYIISIQTNEDLVNSARYKNIVRMFVMVVNLIISLDYCSRHKSKCLGKNMMPDRRTGPQQVVYTAG